MAIATSAAIAIAAAAASTAGTVYAAKKGADANTEAAKINADAATKSGETSANAASESARMQLQAAEDALAFQKAEYARRQAQVSPYVGYGQGALAALGRGLGVESVPQPPVNLPEGTPVPPAGGSGAPVTPGKFTATIGAKGTGQANGLSASGLTTMQAPTGEVSQVPSELVPHYLEQGAKLLNASSVQPQGAA